MRSRLLPALALALGLGLGLAAAPAPAADLPLVTAEFCPGSNVDEFAGCSFACATGWKLEVSSHLPTEKGNHYDATRLEDGSEKTCWASKGEGEWMEYTFEGRSPTWTSELRGFRLYDGYGKSDELWRQNSRVRTFRLQVNGTPRFRLRLVDRRGVQAVTFPGLTMHSGDRLRLVIEDTYPGSRWTDTCVSEIIADGAH